MIEPGRWPLVTAARMLALDRHSIEKLGVPGELLMESAGGAVVHALLAEYAELLAAPEAEICVVCGTGNNAGDGFVVARQLHMLGRRARLALLGPPDSLRGDAAANYLRAEAAGVAIEAADWTPPVRGVIVDAIFGTGLSRKVEAEGAPGQSIERINRSAGDRVRVVAIDLPSGLDADTGQVLGRAVRADLCVTISLPKLGLALEPGRSLAGRVLVARFGIADALPGDRPGEGAEAALLWSARCAARELPTRAQAGHKGSFGHVLVVAGSVGKTGAAALAARAAGRAGAGLVTIACPASLNDILEVKCTEAMTAPVPETQGRAFALAAQKELLELAAERDVVAMGPGVGRAPETMALMRALAEGVSVPLVIDADGLFAFAGDFGPLRARSAATLLTPHPGEAARLLGTSAAEVNADRVGAARTLAQQSGAVVLLKGAASVSAEPGGRVIVNPTGGPLMATGGTGDVLTGVVAALLAQCRPALEAAALAAWIHGAAGDRLAFAHGRSGLLAGDLADALPATIEALRREAAGERAGGGGRDVGAATLLPFPGP